MRAAAGRSLRLATPGDLDETVSLIEKTGRRVISGIVDVRHPDRLRGAFAAELASTIRVNSVHPRA